MSGRKPPPSGLGLAFSVDLSLEGVGGLQVGVSEVDGWCPHGSIYLLVNECCVVLCFCCFVVLVVECPDEVCLGHIYCVKLSHSLRYGIVSESFSTLILRDSARFSALIPHCLCSSGGLGLDMWCVRPLGMSIFSEKGKSFVYMFIRM